MSLQESLEKACKTRQRIEELEAENQRLRKLLNDCPCCSVSFCPDCGMTEEEAEAEEEATP